MELEYNITCCPIMLFTRCGDTMKSICHETLRETSFFLVENINNNQQSITLRLLKKCNTCRMLTLNPTNSLITMDSHSICGVHELPKGCLKHCNHKQEVFNICISRSFVIGQQQKTVLWKSNNAGNSGCLSMDITAGQHIPFHLRVFDCRGNFRVYHCLGKQQYHIPFNDSPLIQFIRSDSNEPIHGTFEIKSNVYLDL